MKLVFKNIIKDFKNKAIFKRLKALGVDEFQGYYFAKPTPLEEL